MGKPTVFCLLILSNIGITSPALGQLTDISQINQGKQIYLEGKLFDGSELIGSQQGSISLRGVQAACVNCHRPSGLGSVEGNEIVPPISGRALFGEGEPVIVRQDERFEPGFSSQHAPYNEATFSEAVKLGRHISGRNMNQLMPRYDLSEKQLQAVSAYLSTLSATWSPGATQNDIHFATVITPGISLERRKVFLDTLNAMINQHNVNVVSGLRQKVPIIERKLKMRRTWSLEVRELSGPSSTWSTQLDQWQKMNPAFAILSGLANDEWQPVQDFCERSKVACWFPSIDLVPQGAANSAYSLYFSEGIALEAKVIARKLSTTKNPPRHLVQMTTKDGLSIAAAEELQSAMKGVSTEIKTIVWDQSKHDNILSSLKDLGPKDVMVFWTGCDVLQNIESTKLPSLTIFVSSTFCKEKSIQLPAGWDKDTWLLQRLELPDFRSANLIRFNGWIKYRNLLLVDEKMQSEVFFAVNSMNSMLTGMLNNLYTNYLIERAETTLSMTEAMQVQEEIQSMMMGGGGRRPPSKSQPIEVPLDETKHLLQLDMQTFMKKKSTTAYPHISLAPGQRFASKGAYLQKIDSIVSGEKDGDAEWIVP
jgi:cytochrome c553